MITWNDLGNSIWLAAFLIILSSAIFLPTYLAAYLLCKTSIVSLRTKSVILWGILGGLPLGFTGMIAGFLTGSSRSPAVSALVPAILTFVGLVVVYVIGKGRVRAVIVDFTIFAFSINLLVGTVLGTASRDRYDEQLASIDVQEAKADREFKVRLYCKGLGLILDMSKPCPVELSKDKEENQEKP